MQKENNGLCKLCVSDRKSYSHQPIDLTSGGLTFYFPDGTNAKILTSELIELIKKNKIIESDEGKVYQYRLRGSKLHFPDNFFKP